MGLAVGVDGTVELRARSLDGRLAAEDMGVGVGVGGNVVLGCCAVVVAVAVGAGCA